MEIKSDCSTIAWRSFCKLVIDISCFGVAGAIRLFASEEPEFVDEPMHWHDVDPELIKRRSCLSIQLLGVESRPIFAGNGLVIDEETFTLL